jgi:hypothetical protein
MARRVADGILLRDRAARRSPRLWAARSRAAERCRTRPGRRPDGGFRIHSFLIVLADDPLAALAGKPNRRGSGKQMRGIVEAHYLDLHGTASAVARFLMP